MMTRHKAFCSTHNRGCDGCACTEDSPSCLEAQKPFGEKMDAALKAAGLVVVPRPDTSSIAKAFVEYDHNRVEGTAFMISEQAFYAGHKAMLTASETDKE